MIVAKNNVFLMEYRPHIVREWRHFYIHYDELTAVYKSLKARRDSGHFFFDDLLTANIKLADDFVFTQMGIIHTELETIERDWRGLSEAEKNNLVEQTEKTAERALRGLYVKTKNLRQYYQLNCFLIEKLSKKYDKILRKSRKDDHSTHNFKDDFQVTSEDSFYKWSDTSSYAYYMQHMKPKDAAVSSLLQDCINTYTVIFRQTYPEMAAGELEFSKLKENETRNTKAYLGIKIGIVLSVLFWIILDSFLIDNEMDFWTNPGLYVYSSVGGFLIYKLSWGLDVYTWSHYNINYISLFKTKNLKPNTTLILNETMNWYVIYFLGLLFYFRANADGSFMDDTSTSCLPPFVMVTCLVIAVGLSSVKNHQSRDLFNSTVWYNILVAPLVPVTFRDNYAADVLTSFTKVISDSLYASCWVVSGTFLQSVEQPSSDNPNANPPTIKHFGSSYMSCTNSTMTYVTGLFVVFPLWIRFAQCLRNYKDKGGVFPNLWNALKYFLSALVVVYGFFQGKSNTFYLILIAVTTLYKWWWDVVMDWGLFDTMAKSWRICEKEPGRMPFLRPVLLYGDYKIYYACIVLDLILRFLWVASLAPDAVLDALVQPGIQIFLGMLEIMRRGMWGVFRVEYEHLKILQNNALGVKPGSIKKPADDLSLALNPLSNSETSYSQSTEPESPL